MPKSSENHSKPTIVWFRQDLRIEDHPALAAASELGNPIIPIYIWSPEDEGKWPIGAASKWWLHHSLESLQNELSHRNLKLIILKGSYLKTLMKLVEETESEVVLWNRCYEPAFLESDTAIKAALQKKGMETKSFNGSLLYDPWKILNKQHKPFKVFTYFWKDCLKSGDPSQPAVYTKHFIAYPKKIVSESLDSLELLPKIHWDKGLIDTWQPGEKHAQAALKKAIKTVLPNYTETRDFPFLNGTSQLSPYLHFGEISPRAIWQAVSKSKELDKDQAQAFLRQLGWREFGYYLLYHFPHTPEHPLYPKYENLPWRKDPEGLTAWQKGLTGYPLIDAGMRQLWKIGWMHNRVRMLVGSFLVKDLLIAWQEGEKWFWDTLVDANLANNTLGWQWVGGCGADAAPYFRVFNPVVQGEKFDAKGEYVKKWVPELADLPVKWIHRPWEAPEDVLRQAGVVLGENYPKPLVDHDQARLRALEGFKSLKNFEDEED